MGSYPSANAFELSSETSGALGAAILFWVGYIWVIRYVGDFDFASLDFRVGDAIYYLVLGAWAKSAG